MKHISELQNYEEDNPKFMLSEERAAVSVFYPEESKDKDDRCKRPDDDIRQCDPWVRRLRQWPEAITRAARK